MGGLMAELALMRRVASFPQDLAEMVENLVYRPGFEFRLADVDRGQGSKGLTLMITVETPDSYNHASKIRVCHHMIVPSAAFDRRSAADRGPGRTGAGAVLIRHGPPRAAVNRASGGIAWPEL
jgi:hypothetical protein